jgi:lipoate-protein ligase A
MIVDDDARKFSAPFSRSRFLFDHLDVINDSTSRSAALNMAIDEALLETATAPTIRFYRWDHPALSFGYFGKFDDVEKEKRDVVRRWTGGGIVFHGDDLTYSIVIPVNDSAFGESSMSIYEKVHRAIQVTVGSGAELEGRDAALRRPRTSQRDVPTNQCFANPVRADVLWNGKKVAGAAQRRTRRGLLQQGSIQNVDLAPEFEKNLAAQLSQNCIEQTIEQAHVERAEQIAKEKYATAAWLQRR